MKDSIVSAVLGSTRTIIVNPPWQLIGFILLLVCILVCYAKLYDKLEKIEKQLNYEDNADKGTASQHKTSKK